MHKRLILIAALMSLPLWAANDQKQTSIDDWMTKAEQKQTGVTRLSKKQKTALAAWLDENFGKTKHPSQRMDTGKQLFLSENQGNGKVIVLSDNSKWEVDPKDLYRSAVWLFPIPISIEASGDAQYPYKLVNQNTKTSIQVRQLTD